MAAVVHDENLDLYLVATTALVFTVLGVTGVARDDLPSIILATLAVLALAQIRSRSHVSRINAQVGPAAGATFSREFPPELEARRSAAQDFFFVGVSMYRTLPTLRNDLHRMALRSHRARVLLVDPDDDALLEMAAQRGGSLAREDLAARIRATLAELERLNRDTARPVEIRVSAVLPAVGLNIIDKDSPTGLVVAQHYEFRPEEDGRPITRLSVDDGYWYHHFVREAERMWEAARPWSAARRRSVTGPAFTLDFDASVFARITDAADLLITGVARNELLTAHNGKFEQCLRQGGRIRLLLVDPASDGLTLAAGRYRAVRDPQLTADRVNQSIHFARSLAKETGGDIELRLTTHPLSVGLLAVRDANGANAYVEYYLYHGNDDLKFALGPHDTLAYPRFLDEAEQLWADARPVDLTR